MPKVNIIFRFCRFLRRLFRPTIQQQVTKETRRRTLDPH